LCKLLVVTRETKLTRSIALNPKSKLTLECGTNHTNRNTIILMLLWSEIMDGYNFPDTMVEIGA